MPRDLATMVREGNVDATPELTKSPDDLEEEDDDNDRRLPADLVVDTDGGNEGMLFGDMVRRNEKRDQLHPYTQTLTLADLESCTKLEEAAFPPDERATREKFQYRLKAFGELCMGIYASSSPSDPTVPTTATSTPVQSGTPERKSVLLGHIIATKSTNTVVTEADMAIPDPSKEDGAHHAATSTLLAARTIHIHSLAILPAFQRHGLGKTLLKAYLQRMHAHDVADAVALIARDALVPFYENLGFENRGRSKVGFAGGGWLDLVADFRGEDVAAALELED